MSNRDKGLLRLMRYCLPPMLFVMGIYPVIYENICVTGVSWGGLWVTVGILN